MIRFYGLFRYGIFIIIAVLLLASFPCADILASFAKYISATLAKITIMIYFERHAIIS